MKYFRHVGLIFPIIKVFIVLGAGFGLLDALNAQGKLRVRKFLICLGAFFILIYSSYEAKAVVYMVTHCGVWSNLLSRIDYSHIQYRLWGYFTGFSLFLALSLVLNKNKTANRRSDQLLLTCVFLSLGVDIFFFQSALAEKMPKLESQNLDQLKATRAHELTYVPQRSGLPSNEHQELALLLERDLRKSALAHYDDTFWGFSQMDPPFDQLKKTVLVNNYVKRLINTPVSSDQKYDVLFGVGFPKIRLVPQATYAPDDDQIIQKISMDRDFVQKVYLVKPGLHLDGSDHLEGKNQVKVLTFTANEIALHISISQVNGVWLVYADAYHPGWKAYISNVKTEVFRANVAFKAVFLPQGEYDLHLMYSNYWMSFLSHFIAFIGISCAMGSVVLILLRVLFST